MKRIATASLSALAVIGWLAAGPVLAQSSGSGGGGGQGSNETRTPVGPIPQATQPTPQATPGTEAATTGRVSPLAPSAVQGNRDTGDGRNQNR